MPGVQERVELRAVEGVLCFFTDSTLLVNKEGKGRGGRMAEAKVGDEKRANWLLF